MHTPTTRDEAISLLLAFHDLARAGRPCDLGTLAGRLGWGVARVVRVLAHLDRRGFANRSSSRLTLAGLAVGVALAAERDERASSQTELDRAAAA
jgi:DNA-binding IclR family transcriptional regulator